MEAVPSGAAVKSLQEALGIFSAPDINPATFIKHCKWCVGRKLQLIAIQEQDYYRGVSLGIEGCQDCTHRRYCFTSGPVTTHSCY